MWDDENQQFHVVVNHEEQYSIWPQGRELPTGWKSLGDAKPKQECLDEIETLWTDMRPLSLRQKMQTEASA